MRRHSGVLLAMAMVWGVACASEPEEAQTGGATPQGLFWASLEALCGAAYGGSVIESVPADSTMSAQYLIMHVMTCAESEIRIPFHVGEDRSRTWVITRVPGGLHLRHEHRHEDGSEDAVTQYGGMTVQEGTEGAQEFAADQYTAELVPAAATNIWSMEVLPGRRFAYSLRRIGSDRRFRAEFDLTAPIDTPPPPWGS